MKARNKMRIGAAAMLLVATLATAPARAQEPAPGLEEVARAFAAEFFEGRDQQAYARLDQRMKELSPPEKLAQLREALRAQVGGLRSITRARRMEIRGMQAVVLACEFEKASLEMRVVFDAAGRVAGMFFAPAAAPWTPPDYADAKLFTEQEVTLGSAPWELPGTLTLPAGGGRFPGVVLVHGSGPQDRDESLGPNKMFKDLAWGLASRGVAVLRYEKRTRQHARALMAESKNFTVYEETIQDAQAGVALLHARPEVDPARVFVLGHSLGGMLAPRVASGATLAGIIIAAGNTRKFEELLVEQVKYLAALDGKITGEEQKQIESAEISAAEFRRPDLEPSASVSVLGAMLPAAYVLDLRAYDPAAAAAKLNIPILVLQGERDYQVTMKDFAGWQKALAGRRNATLKSFPQLNHFLMPGSSPPSNADYLQPGHTSLEVIETIAQWVKAQAARK
jgi:hypothetical protein